MALIFKIQPYYINEALQDLSWIEAMQEELNQFEKSKVWTLVLLTKRQSVICARWVFIIKLDESGKVIKKKKKARLVTQGYNEQEGIDYDES